MSSLNRLLCALFLAFVFAAPALADAPTIVIDGSQLPADVPALVADGRVLVPLRGVFEQLGASVSYDATSQTATASLGDRTVQITVGSRTAKVNDKSFTLDVAPREFAGRVMIPLRFVAQSLGVVVDYDGPSNTVVIVSGEKLGSFAAMTSGPSMASTAGTSGYEHAPTVEDMRPSTGTVVGSEYPSIYARFNGGLSAVDPSSVRVVVDGADVTGSSTISSAYVSYQPTSPMLTGLHSVTITGAADNGATFTSGWSFRIDAGTSSDYTVGTYGGGGGYGYGYGSGYGYGGLDHFGFPSFGFGHFGFFPPGFSLFTPGPLFFVAGGVVNVVFVSQFFPFGNAFFTISGFPGTFPLTPWLGNPGFFWGVAQVPFGVTSHNAVITARFETPGGRKVVVRSTAPLQIEGQRRSLPADLHYAVLAHVVNQPVSLRRAVSFERVMAPAYVSVHPSKGATQLHNIEWTTDHLAPGFTHPVHIDTHFEPTIHAAPIAIHPAMHPVIHPVIQPGIAPVMRFPMAQWQFQMPSHPAAPPPAAHPKR